MGHARCFENRLTLILGRTEHDDQFILRWIPDFEQSREGHLQISGPVHGIDDDRSAAAIKIGVLEREIGKRVGIGRWYAGPSRERGVEFPARWMAEQLVDEAFIPRLPEVFEKLFPADSLDFCGCFGHHSGPATPIQQASQGVLPGDAEKEVIDHGGGWFPKEMKEK